MVSCPGPGDMVSQGVVSKSSMIPLDTESSKHKNRNKGLELSEDHQPIREVAEEAGSNNDDLDKLDKNQEEFKGSDMDLNSYQEQLEEATKALLRAGQYLESETNNKKYLLTSSDQPCYEEDSEQQDSDLKGSGPYLPMVGKVSKTDVDIEEGEVKASDTNQSLLSSVGLDWLFSDSEPDQPQVKNE